MKSQTHTLPDTVDALRREIVTGRFQPGQQLPSCRKLAQRLGANYVTVHRALGVLARDGFVSGHQVAANPPHLFRYGIIFPSAPVHGNRGYWPPSWRGLNDLALSVEHIDPRRKVVPYYNIDGHKDVPDYQQLLLDLRASRLAGLIFATGCAPAVLTTPLFAEPDLPRVMLYVPQPSAQAVSVLGDRTYISLALDYLAQRGRKRIAVFDIPAASLDVAWLNAQLAQRGQTTRSSWILPVNPETRDTAQPVAELLMSLPAGERPDGLFIANTFLAEHVTAGVAAAGVRVPAELDIVAAADFPVQMRASTPVEWVGDDMREGLYNAICLIDEQRRTGQRPRDVVSVYRFEDELTAVDPLQQLTADLERTVTAAIT